MVTPIDSEGFVFGPRLLCSNWCPILLCYRLYGEEKAGCFTIIVFLIFGGCWCSVVLPHSTDI